jgi:hypothetical protein
MEIIGKAACDGGPSSPPESPEQAAKIIANARITDIPAYNNLNFFMFRHSSYMSIFITYTGVTTHTNRTIRYKLVIAKKVTVTFLVYSVTGGSRAGL